MLSATKRELAHEEKETPVRIKIDSIQLEGILGIPKGAQGLVVFAHGSGSGRFSVRNNFVAHVLRKAGFATLLFDLLTEEEDQNYENRFDINLLSDRLVRVTEWLSEQEDTKKLVVGYFGASTGAAAAIEASAKLPKKLSIKAIVSRGGRPDMAIPYLPKVHVSTLLIVGGRDEEVIELNREAYEHIQGKKDLVIVAGATHLFEEPGTLEEVARLAAEWFTRYLR